MNYLSNFHWIWYGIGFVFCPRITIMIALSVHGAVLNIPLFLMVIGWITAILTHFGSTGE